MPRAAISESVLSNFNLLRRHFRVAWDWAFERERRLRRRCKPQRLRRPVRRATMSGKSMITVEFAHDPHDPIDCLEIRSFRGSMHCAVGHEQRFVEAAHLKGEKFGRRLRHMLDENLLNEIAHPLERNALSRGDFGD